MFGKDEDKIKGISDADIRAYFAKNDNINLSVPLAVAQQVADEVLTQLAAAGDATALDLARMQGMLIGVKRFAKLYAAGVERAVTGKRAGK